MINYDLTKIRAIVFDIDGVLSSEAIAMTESGDLLRTVNVKDGYAIQFANKAGLRIAIITGGTSEAILSRYKSLGVEEIHMGCARKIQTYEQFLQRHSLSDEEVLYMGDDIPDLEILRRVGCPCCPADACQEVLEASCYVSHLRGGQGCARDVIEQVLRAQKLWLASNNAYGW